MKQLARLLILLLFATPVKAQVIASETFENSISLFGQSGAAAGFVNGNSAAPMLPVSSPQSSQATYGYAVTNGTMTLTTNAINTLNYTNIELSLKLAAFSMTATAGLDQVDRVRVGISTTGGAIWTDAVTVTGAATSNSYWAFNATGVAASVYPNQAIFNAASTGANAAGYSTIQITDVPSASDVRIRIVLNNGSNERWVIDNFTLTGLSTLPVKLVSFTGNKTTDGVLLDWKIAEPEDGAIYELQKGGDGSHFSTIYTTNGDNVLTNFRYTDAGTGTNDTYYRLRITDKLSKVTYSQVLRIAVKDNFSYSIYPNPVENEAVLNTTGKSLRGTQARIVDINGNTLKRFVIAGELQSFSVNELKAGVYFLQVADEPPLRFIKK